MCDVNHCVCSHPCHTISVQSYFLLQLLCVLHLLFSLHVYECSASVSMYYECQCFRLLKFLGIHYYTDFTSSPFTGWIPLCLLFLSTWLLSLSLAVHRYQLVHSFSQSYISYSLVLYLINFLASFFPCSFINKTTFQPYWPQSQFIS